LQDAESKIALVSLLEEQLPEGIVLLGATAGVRHALADGTVSQHQVDRFSALLRDRLGNRAQFCVLSGQQEGRAEWEAVVHELRCRPGRVDAPPQNCVGMLSGGGMSCQLVLQCFPTVEPEAFSFENGVLAPGGLADRASRQELTLQGLLQGLRAHEEQAAIDASKLPHRLRGTFALIEWVALFVAGGRTDRDRTMGLGYERFLTRHEVLAALESHMVSLREEAKSSPCRVPRPVAVALVYGTIIRTMLREVFDDSAKFYCMTGVGWTMGHYLLAAKQVMSQVQVQAQAQAQVQVHAQVCA